jgi:hypothetical protein
LPATALPAAAAAAFTSTGTLVLASAGSLALALAFAGSLALALASAGSLALASAGSLAAPRFRTLALRACSVFLRHMVHLLSVATCCSHLDHSNSEFVSYFGQFYKIRHASNFQILFMLDRCCPSGSSAGGEGFESELFIGVRHPASSPASPAASAAAPPAHASKFIISAFYPQRFAGNQSFGNNLPGAG